VARFIYIFHGAELKTLLQTTPKHLVKINELSELFSISLRKLKDLKRDGVISHIPITPKLHLFDPLRVKEELIAYGKLRK